MLDPNPMEYHLWVVDDNVQQGNGWETKLVIRLKRNSSTVFSHNTLNMIGRSGRVLITLAMWSIF